ncbi:MAG: metallophosphoesterase, partial [Actinomycetota bacterium]|nr:metallophosphoesterase [Actinomycetota bacterium]
AAGDIACDPADGAFNAALGTPKRCRMQTTADLIAGITPDVVLALGDNQYTDGARWKFEQSYAKTWGRFRAITRPVPGNHEYVTRRASGHFGYFGARAGPTGRGYYSFELGAWHVVALNSNCISIGGCAPDSRQLRWLRADLAANRNRCVLAYWHAPLFSSGGAGGDPRTRVFWQALAAAGADVILNGHDHDYERLAPQTPSGKPDALRGMREFVVGTGGRSLLPMRDPLPTTESRDNTTYGLLKLTLSPTGYDWQFVAAGEATFTDEGSGVCH